MNRPQTDFARARELADPSIVVPTRLQLHLAEERASKNKVHPDGCFHCGGGHATGSCDVDERRIDS